MEDDSCRGLKRLAVKPFDYPSHENAGHNSGQDVEQKVLQAAPPCSETRRMPHRSFILADGVGDFGEVKKTALSCPNNGATDLPIGRADVVSFSCYPKPPAKAGGAFILL
ncbi:MAG: hypothetical protein LBU06_02135 [Desulfovibrio sp.]|jgi:hypothetical protein|nr:hypothetical protein [Desulfovibrio sp.]